MLESFDIFKDKTHNCYQLRTKTNSYTLDFDDNEKESIFLTIVEVTKKNPNILLSQIKHKVGQRFKNENKIIEVLKILNDYRLLSHKLSGELEPQKQEQYTVEKNRLEHYALSIIGEGKLTAKMNQEIKKLPFKSVKSYDLKKLELKSIIERSDFIIFDASKWSPYHAEELNKLAIKYNKPWLYVGGLEGISIKIGPLFYGNETGCYNCLISRLKSNHDYPAFLVSYENHLRENKIGSATDRFPNEDTAHNIAVFFIIAEIQKFIENWALPITWRTILEMNYITFDTTKHTLLKKPYCEICKPELKYNIAPWLEPITLK